MYFLQEAIESFKEALKQKVDFIDAYKSLGQAYRSVPQWRLGGGGRRAGSEREPHGSATSNRRRSPERGRRRRAVEVASRSEVTVCRDIATHRLAS